MKRTVIGVLAVCAVLLGNQAFSEQGKDIKAVIELPAGNKGDVTFPHVKHHKVVPDCQTCHAMYPQKTSGISNDIKAGKLKKKQAMGHCLSCHRANKAENKKSGPTSCNECHKK